MEIFSIAESISNGKRESLYQRWSRTFSFRAINKCTQEWTTISWWLYFGLEKISPLIYRMKIWKIIWKGNYKIWCLIQGYCLAAKNEDYLEHFLTELLTINSRIYNNISMIIFWIRKWRWSRTFSCRAINKST